MSTREKKRPVTPARKPRVEAARDAGRRRLFTLGGPLALAALCGAALGIAHSPLISAREVRIIGATHGEGRAILAVSGLGAHPPLIDINLAADTRAIERLPWVDTARVAVAFPSSASVTVTERVPVAFVAAGRGGALVDASGRVLADVNAKPAGVVTVESADAPPRPGRSIAQRDRALFAVAAEVPAALLGRIASVASTRRDGVVVKMTNEPLAIFGSPTDAHEKFIALATVLADVSLVGIAAIDLRAPSNPVLTP
jgi:cell division septal protein FtsQ